jgi:hypothetical protein
LRQWAIWLPEISRNCNETGIKLEELEENRSHGKVEMRGADTSAEKRKPSKTKYPKAISVEVFHYLTI